MRLLTATVSTSQPSSQPLELLQALGKMMGKIRPHLRFRHLVLSFLKFAVTVCSRFETFFPQNTNKKEGPEPNTTGPADGQSEYSRYDETTDHKHFHQTAPIPIPRAVRN